MGEVVRLTKTNNPKISCFKGVSSRLLCANPRIKLILSDGTTKVIKGHTRMKAGEIMFEFPNCVVCHADSFFLGRPIPVLEVHGHLVAGGTYFVLPLDHFLHHDGPLSAASLQSLYSLSNNNNSGNTNTSINGYHLYIGGCDGNGTKSPFEYIKDKDGRTVMIKVVPEFITWIISANNGPAPNPSNCSPNNSICTTPELQKQYEKLVRAKNQAWSPKLETIPEDKIRSSPKLSRLDLSR